MSNLKHKEYIEAYSQLVSKMVELHNRNRDFAKRPNFRARTDVRNRLAEMLKIIKNLRNLANLATREEAEIRKLDAEQKKLEESLKPPRGQRKMGRPRKYPPKPPKGTRPMGRPRKYPKPESPPEGGDQG
jgi:hypothetical protein